MQFDRTRTALITGGASGIGLGIARALFSTGMNVAIADIRDDHFCAAREFFAEEPERLCEVHLDVANRANWSRAAHDIVERFGAIHVLCLNAGIGVLGPILGARQNDWDWLLSVNLGGVVNGVTEILPRMRAQQQGGHIVATSSMGGLIVGPTGGIYSTAKFGVVALMECLRSDLVAENIGVSVLCPAAVNTHIYDHGGMRPEHFRDSHYILSAEEEQRGIADAKSLLSMGRDPLEVGEFVRLAIERNEPYIFTDCNVKANVQGRMEALRAFATERHACVRADAPFPT
jgi:NAD(P)-dependent dehydrogenase (short-subunit alcohol dehydrogenase family)